MSSPFDRLFDKADWRPLERPDTIGNGIPFATHEGILHIGELTLRVYQLNTGERIIEESDFVKFFGHSSMAELKKELKGFSNGSD